jgi:hypothetical protein
MLLSYPHFVSFQFHFASFCFILLHLVSFCFVLFHFVNKSRAPHLLGCIAVYLSFVIITLLYYYTITYFKTVLTDEEVELRVRTHEIMYLPESLAKHLTPIIGQSPNCIYITIGLKPDYYCQN